MAKKLNIKPLGDRIVVRRLEAEDRTAGGIVLPDTAKEKPRQGEVVAVGDGALTEEGKHLPMHVKVGDRIVFTSYAGTEIKHADEDLLIMREEDVLGIIQK
ncbi:MAG TPA: co-chaperone GroES [Planctomycetota bacterium]|nr:co-chaperone GroES [Planctomycetota bacterium]HRT95158.1 co-chaperone GroES [Planctomycetota bacterium]